MKRVIICVLDSFGIGAAPDAAKYGDEGANTLGHIAEAIPNIKLDNMGKLGLWEAFHQANGFYPTGVIPSPKEEIIGSFGIARETSFGKDTPSGHWEMMGVPVLKDWLYMPYEAPSFPSSFLDEIAKRTNLDGFLGNKGASGTEILTELGSEHIRLLKKGKRCPIIYTSADSVLQIAVYEDLFGLENLYTVCKTARALLDEMDMYIGRVIARPFTFQEPDTFTRNPGRHDYSVPPPAPTLLEQLSLAGYKTTGIGKIPDIYAHIGITREVPAPHNSDIFSALLSEMTETEGKDSSIIMANFVDFDMLFGHRRDVKGYGEELEQFDSWLPDIMKDMNQEDLLIITADHGCDPSYKGTEHTREYVPILTYSAITRKEPTNLGEFSTFAAVKDIASAHLDFS